MEAQGGAQKPAERRKTLRSPIIVLKVAEGDGKEYLFGYAKNISRGGLFIQSINPRKPGEQYTISFRIPGAGIHVRCRCEVVWTQEYKKKSRDEPGYGVRFLDLPEEVASAIDQWIQTNSSA